MSDVDSLYWHTKPWNKGQIVEYSEPQIPGAAEGNGGAGDGLTLRFDHSDREWSVWDVKLGKIMEGKGDCPIVPEAIKARATSRKTRLASSQGP